MDPITDNRGSRNLVGAAIFWLYILFAFICTAIILQTLFALYQRHNATNNDARRNKHVRTFGFLALISFGTLSFNMLEVLIQSFKLWSRGSYPTLLTEYPATIWHWSITSSLFQDFGEAIVADSARFFWTQSALLATLAVCFFMAIQGRQHKVPRLWAFFCISQILPISFAQNLFYVARLLSTSEATRPARVSKLKSVATVAFYCSCLANAQLTAGTVWLMPLILVARAFLLVPLALVKKQGEDENKDGGKSADYLTIDSFIPIMTLTSAVMTGIKVLQIKEEGWSMVAVWSTLFSHPAVSSLGCDFIMSIFSFVVWSLLSNQDVARSAVGQRKG